MVDLYDSVVIPFAHSNMFLSESGDITYEYSLIRDRQLGQGYRPPDFEYTTRISDSNPFVVEFRIQNVSFSDSGDYRILFNQQSRGSEVVTITINCKFIYTAHTV